MHCSDVSMADFEQVNADWDFVIKYKVGAGLILSHCLYQQNLR